MEWVLVSMWVCTGYCPAGTGHVIQVVAKYYSEQLCHEIGRQTMLTTPYGDQYRGIGYTCTLQYRR